MKLTDILATASANMFRSKLRTFLTIIAIFVGAFTLTLTNGLGSGISSYITKQVNDFGATNVITITAAASTTSTSDTPQKYDPSKKIGVDAEGPGITTTLLTNADVAKIQKIAGITSVEPDRSIVPDYIEGSSSGKYQVAVAEFVSGSQLTLAAGNTIDASSTTNQLIIPVSYVSSLGYSDPAAAIGKTATLGISDGYGQLHEVEGTIVGVEQKSLVGGSSISINDALRNALYNEESIGLPAASQDGYASVTARFDSGYNANQISTLKNNLKNQGYGGETVADRIGTFQEVINGIIAVLDAFAVIALLAASFGIINTLLMSVQERTKEIGLMKAMGMSGSRIFLLFSFEAVLLGFWGSALGVVVAEIVGRVANHIVSNGFLKDLAGLQLLTFPVRSVAFIILLVMAVAFVAGTLPAYRAARQSPIDSLRYE
jgi:putative ABC transport system permease protein